MKNHNSLDNDPWMNIAVSGIDLPEGAEVTYGDHGERLISLDSAVPYPRDYANSDPEGDLFLPISKFHQGFYVIPRNATGLPAILNEAVGASESLGVRPDESRAMRLIEGIMHNLFEEISEYGNITGNFPKDLKAEQVLVVKDHYAARLLPPITLDTPLTQSSRIKALKESLADSLDVSADTVNQMKFANIIRAILNS